jgi:hypothetical protein
MRISGSDWALTVIPHIFCAAQSSTAGAALTLLTAGVAGTFSITAADMYSSFRTASDTLTNFIVRMVFDDTPTSLSARTLSATGVSGTTGVYAVGVSTTRAAAMNLFATWAPASTGLVATYFDTQSFTSPRLVRTDASIDFSAASGAGFISTLVNGEFSVRWTGYAGSGSACTGTFSIQAINSDERVPPPSPRHHLHCAGPSVGRQLPPARLFYHRPPRRHDGHPRLLRCLYI